MIVSKDSVLFLKYIPRKKTAQSDMNTAKNTVVPLSNKYLA